MELDAFPEMLRVEEVARVLRVSRSRAYEAVAAFEQTGGMEGIPVIRVGRCMRVPKAALLAWIDAQIAADATDDA